MKSRGLERYPFSILDKDRPAQDETNEMPEKKKPEPPPDVDAGTQDSGEAAAHVLSKFFGNR